MEMVESFHPVTWKCCSSSSSDNDDNDDMVEQDMKEWEKEDEVKKDQKEKEKEKICLIFIKQNRNISIHI